MRGRKIYRRLAGDVVEICDEGCLYLGNNMIVLQLLFVEGILKWKRHGIVIEYYRLEKL